MLIGIDLGTTNSLVACFRNGRAELIPNRLGSVLTPSVVSIDERGKLYVTVTMPEGYSGKHINMIWPVVNGTRLETPMLVKMTTGAVND